MSCLEKLKQGSEMVKKGSKDKGKAILMNFFSNPHVAGDLSNVISPLNPSFRCKSVKVSFVRCIGNVLLNIICLG